MIAPLFFLFIYSSICSEPTWTTYSPNVMYAGEYKAFLTAKSTGLLATVTQTMYRTDVTAGNYFTTAPRIILSLLGYQQSAPVDGNAFTGFDVKLSTITTTNFQVIHNIYGAGMGNLNYMYLAIAQGNTDFFMGEYSQVFDQTSTTKSYSHDIAVNGNETYASYGTNTIEMKGFLAGYKLKQGTASEFELKFSLSVKSASQFTIQVSTNANSVLEQVNYYRIGYDRTNIERRTYRNVFRDFDFELINNVNTKNAYNASMWATGTEFQYRNFLMGTNRISITGTVPMGVEFLLYYNFFESLSKTNVTTPYYVLYPAKAKYLYGEAFYHVIPSCTAPDIYYSPVDRKCYSSCPSLGYFTDTSSNTCIACHFTCRTCSAGYSIDKCLSCDINYRVLDSTTSKCNCPVKTYDDLINLACPSCHASCLTCASAASNDCKTCDATLNKELSDPNNDGLGQCVCRSTFYEDSNTGQCQSCAAGCLTCSFSTGSEVCSSCDTVNNWNLIDGACVCPTQGYVIETVSGSSNCVACHYSCLTCSAGTSSDKCLTCDTNFRLFDSTTKKCNCPALTYDDLTNLVCPSCHPSCLSCTSAASNGCKSCDGSLNREFNDPNNDGIGQCLCKSTFSQNPANGQCQSCSLGCLSCSFLTGSEICSSCDTANHWNLVNRACQCPTQGYVIETVSGSSTCSACHYTCQTCSVGSMNDKCLTCDTNYRVFNSTTKKCNCPSLTFDDLLNLACPSCHPSCLTCASSALNGCKSCDASLNREFNDPNNDGVGACICKNKYSQNFYTGLCQSCSLSCLVCSFSTGAQVCSSCDTVNHWALVNGTCVCPTQGYVIETILGQSNCVACHYTCQTCSAGTSSDKCLTCDTNYRVFDSTTKKCNCLALMYDDTINLACQSCHISCLTCISSGFNMCKSCNSTLNRELKDQNFDGIGECMCKHSYYEKPTDIQCQSCSKGCLSCTFSGGAEVCLSCNASENLKLDNSSCFCDVGYALVNGSCILEKCGDGIRTQSQQCDDKNLINKDGCSSLCKIQTEHVCIQNSNISSNSICYFNGTIAMTITDVTKSLSSNQVSLTIKIDTSSNVNEDFLTNYLTSSPSIVIEDVSRRLLTQFNKRILASSNTVITAVSYDSAIKVLQVTFSYDSSFDITKKKIRFQPSLSSSSEPVKYFYNSPEAIISLEKTHNKVDTTYYDLSDYQRANSLKYAFLTLLILFWIMTLVMVFIGKGNVGMEMMMVYQIAYVSLLSQEKLEISFYGLLEYGKYTAGYNVELMKDMTKCSNYAAINIGCNLFNNLNISFFLMVLVAVVFWCLKLANKVLNNRAEKQFLEKRTKKYLQANLEKTNENILPNIGMIDRLSEFHFRSAQSQSVRNIEENYYKDQQFISKRVYNSLLDLEFLLCFVTVTIWAMSVYQIKQSTIESISVAICMIVFYILLWVFWFMKYFKEDFSYIKAHKKTQSLYQDEQQQTSSVQQENQQNQPGNRQQATKANKSKFSASFLKVLIYPIVWLSLLGLGIALAISSPVGYVSQALIMGGSLGFLLMNIIINIYQEKLHRIRSAINCIVLVLIQGLYILSQSDSIVGFGLTISAVIFTLLSLVLISNSAATLYLYRLQVILLRKKKQSMEVQKIQKQINKLQTLKKQKEMQSAPLPFIHINDFKSKSSQHSSSQFEKTVKKDPQYNFKHNENYFTPAKTIQRESKMTRQIVNHNIINENKITLSQSYVPMFKRQRDSTNQKQGSNTQLKIPNNREKSISQQMIQNYTSKKVQNQVGDLQIYLKMKRSIQQ